MRCGNVPSSRDRRGVLGLAFMRWRAQTYTDGCRPEEPPVSDTGAQASPAT
jgi:hypothetical protein